MIVGGIWRWCRLREVVDGRGVVCGGARGKGSAPAERVGLSLGQLDVSNVSVRTTSFEPISPHALFISPAVDIMWKEKSQNCQSINPPWERLPHQHCQDPKRDLSPIYAPRKLARTRRQTATSHHITPSTSSFKTHEICQLGYRGESRQTSRNAGKHRKNDCPDP